MKEFIIEYFHRTIAITTSLLVFLTMISIMKCRKSFPKSIQLSSVIAAILAIVQISLGGIVIVEKLHALLVTVHLGVGLALFSMTLMPVLYTYGVISSPTPTSQDSLLGIRDNTRKRGQESPGKDRVEKV